MAAGLSLFENARQFGTLTTTMRGFPIKPHPMLILEQNKRVRADRMPLMKYYLFPILNYFNNISLTFSTYIIFLHQIYLPYTSIFNK